MEWNCKLRLFNTIIKKISKDKYIVDNYILGLRTTTNESGIEILRLCNGENTLREIIRILDSRYSLDKRDITWITDFIGQCAKWGFFNEYVVGENNITVDWDITYKCNLKCKHCIVNAGKPLPNELSYGDVVDVLNKLAEANFKVIAFSGGEPFIRGDFLDIVREAYELGFVVKILSNGTLITNGIAKKLKEYGVAFVQISLDGPSPDIHDNIRGVKGAFNKTINGIKALVDNDISVGVGTVLMENNFSQLEEIVKLCANLGISVLMPDILLFKGRAANHKIRAPSMTELDVDIYIRELAGKYKSKLKIKNHIDSLIEGFDLANEGLIIPGCSRIRTGIALNPEGYVFPCKGFYGKCDSPGSNIPLGYGKLPRDSMSDILLKRRENRVPTFNEMEPCRDCKYNKICGGGCFAENFEKTGFYNKVKIPCRIYDKFRLLEERGVINI